MWGPVNSGIGASGGGIAPGNMLEFSASSEKGKVKLSCKLPKDTIVDGILLATVSGAKIVRRTDRYPKSEYDGDLVRDIKADSTFVDENTLVGVTYYYQAFPYTDQNIYNRNPANRIAFTPKFREYLYGYDIALANENSSARVSYPAGVDNAGYVPAKMNFSSGKFEPGSWDVIPGAKFMPRPCLLGYDGNVRYYLDPNDYTKKADGGDSRVTDETVDGNFMMEWPKIYTMRWESEGNYHFRCSDQPIAQSDVGAPAETPDSDCWCNYDKSDNVIPYFYTPIYFGSNVSGKLRSLSGKSGMVSQTADTEISYAKKNGADWYTEFIVDRMLIADLLVMMAKTTDSQKAYGNGYGYHNNPTPISSGSMDKNGMFWGSNSTSSGVKVFGMENYWGNIFRHVAGWIMVNGSQKIKLTRGRHDGTTVSDYNTTGNGYLDVGAPAPSGQSSGFISKMKTTPYGRFPYEANGSGSTYDADGFWFNNSGTRYVSAGGCHDYGLTNGLFALTLEFDASFMYRYGGSALSCKPSLEV